MKDNSRIEALINLLGEENTNRIKEKVTDFIIEATADDICDYRRDRYILDPDEIVDFVNECKEKAFNRIKEDIVNQMIEKIKVSL